MLGLMLVISLYDDVIMKLVRNCYHFLVEAHKFSL